MPKALLLLLLLATPAGASSPAAAVVAARADAQRLPKTVARDTRYLMRSPKDRTGEELATFLRVLAFQVNSLSSESEIVRPVLVAPELFRINLLDYGENFAKTWEKLAANDPYFHTQLVKQVVAVEEEEVEVEVGHWHLKTDGLIVTPSFAKANPGAVWWEKTGTQRREKKREAKKQETITSAGPWLPAADIAALVILTGSEVPIVRADWFVSWTAIQAGRKGSGYYDFLGLKSLKDAEELAGLDRKAAAKRRKEIAALVAESGVALNNRQIYWFGTIGGVWWETRDSNTSVAKQDALSRLDKDFEPDALEVYFGLPNDLYGLVASNAAGVLQETVPDTIAPNHVSRSNDRRIHPGLSCIECHTGGLQPIDDWARSVYQGPENPGSPIILAAVDPKKLRRLRQLYLSPLKAQLKKDVGSYAAALLRTNGLTPEKNAAAYSDQWYRYNYTSLGLEEQAFELGTNKERWLKALKDYVAPNGIPVIADPVLVGALAGRKMRREHVEERFALMNQILAGSMP